MTLGAVDDTGTSITFKPDGSIFTVTEYDYSTLANRLRDLAYLNAGITLSLTDKRNVDSEGVVKSEVFYSSRGLSEFVEYIDSNKRVAYRGCYTSEYRNVRGFLSRSPLLTTTLTMRISTRL